MFRYIGFAIRYGWIVVTAVSLAEGLANREATGEEKRDLVVETVLEIIGRFGVRVDENARQIIGQIADLAVSVLNRLGIFTHAVDEADDDVAALGREDISAARVEREPEVSENDARLDELQRNLTQ